MRLAIVIRVSLLSGAIREMKVSVLTLFLACSIAAVTSDVLSCQGGPHEHPDNIMIANCPKTPCKLKRKTDASIELKITPEDDIKSLKNSIYAKILGIPFPFLGVDGTDACTQIFNPDGTKAGCPLKAGQQYIYKNKFKILEVYPKLRLVVHWALTTDKRKDLICFEVPARITS